ncbi:MAG: hypothetical protein GF381_04505 [Candidatus Pacebacteria bacterium]|nr:hypothetical protein [Candidatus Paceibacterota bacterium]
MPGPKFTPTASGGMRRTVGGPGGSSSGFEEKFDQQALAQAAANKQASQSQALNASQVAGANAGQGADKLAQLEALAGGKGAGGKSQNAAASQAQKPPRSVGSLKQELVSRPIQDAKGELVEFFNVNKLLGIDNQDAPEEQARKKKMHQRWKQLTEAEQKVAQQKYQQKLKQKQEEERQKQIQKQREQEQKSQQIAPPSSPQKGPSLLGKGQKKSGKNLAMGQLQRSRQSMGGPGSPN